MNYLKTPTFRSKSYRRYVAAQECFGCRIEGFSQCAHPNRGKGLGLKTDDRLSFPLCGTRPGHMGCHYMHDNLIDMTKADRWELEERYTAEMQDRARRDGRPEFRNLEAA